MNVKDYILGNEEIDIEAVKKEVTLLSRKYNFCISVDAQKGNGGILRGLPISVKDNICTKDMRTTAGSKILNDYIPTFDATAVSRVREAGGSIVGKANMDEFGFGSFSVHSGYSIPLNPWDPTRVCGGSSGGSGGITAAMKSPHIAMGESTGGSIEAPAAFCGVVGITPTYGLISRYGLVDYANSLDKIGALGKSVYDVALLMSIMAGHDSRDSTSLHVPKQDYVKNLKDNLKGLKIGIPKEYFSGIDPKIAESVWNAIKLLEKHGAIYEEVSLPHTKYSLATYYILAMSEASTNLAKYSGIRYGLQKDIENGESFNSYFSRIRAEGFGNEAKRRLMLGTFARMSGYRDQYYNKALRVRTLIIEDYKKAFKKVDILAAPAMPIIAPKLDEVKNMNPTEEMMVDILTAPMNLAGIPHVNVPTGFVQGMPVGMQLLGDHLTEQTILNVANSYENLVGPFKMPKA